MFSKAPRALVCRICPIRLVAILVLAALGDIPCAAAQAAQPAQPAPSAERSHIEETLKGLSRGMYIGAVALSPDGKRLAWTGGSREGMQLRVASIDDVAKSERVTAAAKPDQRCREGSPVWQPDSNALAFLSDCGSDNGQEDLYLSRLDGSPARRITQLEGYVHEPAFSPDGSKIAFLYVKGATRPAGALAAMKPWAGVSRLPTRMRPAPRLRPR